MAVRGIAALAMIVGVAVSAASAAAQPRGELLERTMAIVAGRAVTLSDVRTALALGLVPERTDQAGAARRLVERALMLREVERYAPPEPRTQDVTRAIDDLRARLSPGQFEVILAEGGFSDARLRAWIRDDLRIAAYLDQRFSAAADIAVEQAPPELRERRAAERRAALVADWLADLRRRTPVIELWQR